MGGSSGHLTQCGQSQPWMIQELYWSSGWARDPADHSESFPGTDSPARAASGHLCSGTGGHPPPPGPRAPLLGWSTGLSNVENTVEARHSQLYALEVRAAPALLKGSPGWGLCCLSAWLNTHLHTTGITGQGEAGLEKCHTSHITTRSSATRDSPKDSGGHQSNCHPSTPTPWKCCQGPAVNGLEDAAQVTQAL